MKKILIVDDNLELAWVLADCLGREGYETMTAASGVEGIKGALAFLPDLVLLDYNLGDMNGHDVAVAIKNMHKTSKIPFLILSAHGGDPMLVRGFSRLPNCRGSMSKLLSTSKVIEAVRKALHDGAPKVHAHGG